MTTWHDSYTVSILQQLFVWPGLIMSNGRTATEGFVKCEGLQLAAQALVSTEDERIDSHPFYRECFCLGPAPPPYFYVHVNIDLLVDGRRYPFKRANIT